ncbi:hypothetical protein L1987_33146 [Smallanthus sonchifolius]|uniref:Uncharacterized protein n=1 Tax=Smallanthus sonchifolius TaxID=185202 RepID=A0ACB9HQJ2_9ASTR|nr:hypothetical protein L1987_33146 [Smallanthus sonchifolius]
MDANGELNKSSSEDIEGLLSLYEASYLGSSEEDVMSHAKEITTRNLNQSVSQLSPKLNNKVVESLKLPRHMRMERLEARRYIEEYSNEDDHNLVVLEFAKYDYNMVQSVLQRELVEWIDMAEAYMVEAEWVKTGRTPTLKDYIENGGNNFWDMYGVGASFLSRI